MHNIIPHMALREENTDKLVDTLVSKGRTFANIPYRFSYVFLSLSCNDSQEISCLSMVSFSSLHISYVCYCENIR